jgi:DNA-directed RNA polymerase specialized sigma24 family protein
MLSDERLARLCGTGNEPAFAVLYRRHGGAVFAYCRSITHNSDDGWDAMQNAMVRVLISLRHGERTPPAWSPLAAWEMLHSVLRVGASAAGLVAPRRHSE